MASTVIIDSVLLLKYRNQIGDAVKNLQKQLQSTERAIETVSQSWKDDQFKTFQKNFNLDKERIKPMCEVLETYRNEILLDLQKKVDRYLNLTMNK